MNPLFPVGLLIGRMPRTRLKDTKYQKHTKPQLKPSQKQLRIQELFFLKDTNEKLKQIVKCC